VRATDGAITTFDAPGAGAAADNGTFGQAINPDGAIAGYYLDASSVHHGFLRAADGTITTFDAPGAGTEFSSGTFVQAINPAGAIAGFYVDASRNFHGFVRAADGGITTFDGPPGGLYVSAINPAGTVAGSYLGHGFVRAASGTITTIDAGALGLTEVTSINPSGKVVGSFNDANGSHGFLRDRNGNFTMFDIPDAFSSATSPQTAGRTAAASRGDDAPTSSPEVRVMSATRAGSGSMLEYSLPTASRVSLAVYDVAGQRVAMLEQGSEGAGVHQVRWDAKGVASGMYFYRLQAGSATVTKSVIILR
jgi:hypothetical protein